MKLNKIIGVFLLFSCCLVALKSQAQQFLPGAQVWRYDDGTIAVRYQGQDQFYTPLNATAPQPPTDPQCSGHQTQPDLVGNPSLDTVVIQPSRNAGGTIYTVDLSKYGNVTAIQIKTLRGAVQVHSAQVVNSMGQTVNLSELLATRLCQDQGITTRNALQGATRLVLKLEGYLSNDVSLAVNIQSGEAACGGCNSYGCWVQGGGCTSYGCYVSGGGCNSYGCYVSGGGCNSYGCWYPGGSCNSYGCQKEAKDSAGKASDHPSCQ